MKIKMLVNTVFGGKRLTEGDEVVVAEKIARMWIARGLALPVEEAKNGQPPIKDDTEGTTPDDGTTPPAEDDTEADGDAEGEDEEEEIDLTSKTAKELYEMCIEKGLEAEPKKSKDYYINLLKG